MKIGSKNLMFLLCACIIAITACSTNNNQVSSDKRTSTTETEPSITVQAVKRFPILSDDAIKALALVAEQELDDVCDEMNAQTAASVLRNRAESEDHIATILRATKKDVAYWRQKHTKLSYIVAWRLIDKLGELRGNKLSGMVTTTTVCPPTIWRMGGKQYTPQLDANEADLIRKIESLRSSTHGFELADTSARGPVPSKTDLEKPSQ